MAFCFPARAASLSVPACLSVPAGLRRFLQPEQGRSSCILKEPAFSPGGCHRSPYLSVRRRGRRAFLAGLCAAVFFPGGAEASPAFARADVRQVLLGRVKRSLGRPYVSGAEGPAAFDCSGLIRWLYAGLGLRLPRCAVDQGSTGLPVRDRLRFGDIVLFKRLGSGWHIGMFLARGFFVHAAGRGQGVIISSLRETYFRKQFRGARRYLR